jgi:hypothetical protein
MRTLLDVKAKAANWISGRFSGGETERYQRDLPGRLARWLFRIGTVWAAILAPIACVCFILTIVVLADYCFSRGSFGTIDRGVFIFPYLLAGYAVWLGWGWRSQKPRNRTICVLMWLASAGFNVMQPVHTWMDCERAVDFFELLWNPLLLWSIGATCLSLLALVFEFSLPRHEDQAA